MIKRWFLPVKIAFDSDLLYFLTQKVERNSNQQMFSHFVDRRNLNQNY